MKKDFDIAQKMKFSIENVFSKCDQVWSFQTFLCSMIIEKMETKNINCLLVVNVILKTTFLKKNKSDEFSSKTELSECLLERFLILCDQFEQEKVNSEIVAWRCSVKKVFLKISQNSQENTCARVSSLIK